MAADYFLANGKKGNGNTIFLEDDMRKKRCFEDISMLDLKTMDIPYDRATDVLKEYNPDIDLSGNYFNVSFPHKQDEMKTYATIFDYSTGETKYYHDGLRYFAEQRKYKKENGDKVKLDINNYFEEYMHKIMYKVLNTNSNYLTKFDSMISVKLKNLIFERKDYFKSTHDFINSRYYILHNLLTNYTELRNLVLMYMLHEQGLDTNIRSSIKRAQNWNIGGLEKDSAEYKQMELADYINVPSIQRTRKKG